MNLKIIIVAGMIATSYVNAQCALLYRDQDGYNLTRRNINCSEASMKIDLFLKEAKYMLHMRCGQAYQLIAMPTREKLIRGYKLTKKNFESKGVITSIYIDGRRRKDLEQ